MEAVIQSIPTSQIEAGDNDRKAFDLVALAQLAAEVVGYRARVTVAA